MSATVVQNIFLAAQTNNIELMRETLKTEDVNTRAPSEAFTPLMIAANYGFYEMVELLLEQGADITAESEGGATALSLSISPKQEECAKIVKRLLQAGAKPNQASGGGNTPLMEACYQGNVAAITLLLEAGADVNAKNQFNETALMTTLIGGDEPLIITTLLKNGADKEVKSSDGETAADIAHRLHRGNSFALLC